MHLLLEAQETLWPIEDLPNKVQLSKEELQLENSDPDEVGHTTRMIFLDFSKIQLKDVHSLQKEALIEIQVRGIPLKSR